MLAFDETLLLGAIVGLSGSIGVLYRQLVRERTKRDYEAKQTTRLMFALLGALAKARGEKPPETISTPEKPNELEARTLAVRALNGEVLELLREYLADTPPKPVRIRRG